MNAVGSITDVQGVLVGHHQRLSRGWQTGTTVILVPQGATPGVDVRGGGPGTRETDALAPTNLVESIHAVCLTGGSAFGLAAADGVVRWLEERSLGFPIAGPPDTGPEPIGVVPVVPAAVIFDLGRGGRFSNRPDESFGYRAADGARGRQARWGAVGAGAGAISGGLQGGVGTASTTVNVPAALPSLRADDQGARHPEPNDELPPFVDVSVGAVAVVNSFGSAIDRATGLPWEPGGLDLRRPATGDRARLRDLLDSPGPWPLNTTIGVVATSARLTKPEASKLASVAHDGLARAIRPAHALVDGDTIFTMATGEHALADRDAGPLRIASLDRLFVAAAAVFATACAHAVVGATESGDAPSYRNLCPSAFRHGPER